MTNIIGPISEEDWTYMLFIRSQIKRLKNGDPSLQPYVKSEEKIYQELRDSYVA